MEVEKLRRKRQKNVQEQNILVKDEICKEALYWRNSGIPTPVEYFLKSKDINPDTSIFINYQQDFPGMPSEYGTVLTEKYEIYRFELDLNKDRTKLIEVSRWENITKQVEITNHKPGTGSTKWFLAIEVLAKLNDS